MLIMFTAGQLGNQIFQYGFIESVKENKERVITSRCEYFDIFEYENKDYIFLNKYNRFILRRVLKILSRVGVFSLIKQHQDCINGHNIDTDSYTYKKGLFSFIKIVEGFYQSNRFINFTPKINDMHIKKSNVYLSTIPKNVQKIFVHVRRGDYIDWSVLGKNNASLPLDYYKKQINWFILNYENPFFLFFSDDCRYVAKEFEYVKNKSISKNNVGVDLAIMSKCENAILSNSTLSWWGVYLMKCKGVVFAPKYWLGWKSKVYYPIGIKIENINYIEVQK